MPEIINCPSCQRKLQVPESLLGQDVQCPTCGATFVASLGQQKAPTPQPPPPTYNDPYSYSQPPPGSGSGYPAPPGQGPGYPGPPGSPPPRQRPSHRDYDYDDHGYDDYDRPRRYRRRDFSPHRGGTILALGIIGIVFCPICGPIAWIMGNQDLQEIKSGRMDPEGEGTTQAGRVCGIIATVFLILGVLYVCFVGMILMSTGMK